ncbi:MAG: hypothetical protein ACT6S0_24685, partial [Roseateles sp.]
PEGRRDQPRREGGGRPPQPGARKPDHQRRDQTPRAQAPQVSQPAQAEPAQDQLPPVKDQAPE